MERRKIRRIALYTIVIAGVLGLIVFALRPSRVSVDTARAVRGPLQITIDQEGQTRAHDRFVVSAPVPGRLMRLELEDGDPVMRNQILARIDPLPLNQREQQEVRARVESAQANLRQAKAHAAHAREDRDLAARDRTRAERLAKEGVISTQALEEARNADITAAMELDAAEFSQQAAASDLKVAQAGLVGLDRDPNNPRPLIELRSPVAGRVLRVVEKSERVVQSGAPIVILGEPDKIEVVSDVLSTDAVKIRPGDPALLDGWGGDHPLRARVRLVEPGGFTKVSALGVEEQRVNVISDFVDSPGSLGDAYRVESHIVIWSGQNVLKIPLSAIFRRGQNWSAFAVEGGRAKAVDLQIGHRNDEEVEILSGILEGQQVILHPSNQVSEGALISPI